MIKQARAGLGDRAGPASARSRGYHTGCAPKKTHLASTDDGPPLGRSRRPQPGSLAASAFGAPGAAATLAKTSVWPPPQSLTAAGPPRLVNSTLLITGGAANPVLSAGIDRHMAVLSSAASGGSATATRSWQAATAPQRAGALRQLHVRLEQPTVTGLGFSRAGAASTDCSYELVVERGSSAASLTARTAFGALYGLETFTQRLLQNPRGGLRLGSSTVHITDAPAAVQLAGPHDRQWSAVL